MPLTIARQVFMQTGRFNSDGQGFWPRLPMDWARLRPASLCRVLSSGGGTSGGSRQLGLRFPADGLPGRSVPGAGDPILALSNPRGITREI